MDSTAPTQNQHSSNRNSEKQPESEKPLLSICIPTYRRPKEFERLLRQLSDEIGGLPSKQQSSILLKVFENPSSETVFKFSLYNSIDLGHAIAKWHTNEANIGGDANIERAHSSSVDANFTWVLGDDEQITEGSLSSILKTLKNQPSLGLLILRDTSYEISSELLSHSYWDNYESFAKACMHTQPHLLIAHTLISANIFSSDIFLKNESQHERKRISKRKNLPFCFSHMKGLLSGLSRNPAKSIRLLNKQALNTTSRARSESKIDNYEQMILTLYKHHMSWLSVEFGLDQSKMMCKKNMSFDLPSWRSVQTILIAKCLCTIKHSRHILAKTYRKAFK